MYYDYYWTYLYDYYFINVRRGFCTTCTWGNGYFVATSAHYFYGSSACDGTSCTGWYLTLKTLNDKQLSSEGCFFENYYMCNKCECGYFVLTLNIIIFTC